jgi:large subunit ribosomal protein L29
VQEVNCGFPQQEVVEFACESDPEGRSELCSGAKTDGIGLRLAGRASFGIGFKIHRQDRAKMKATELREMSDEQLELTAVEAAETLFRLRLQSQTDRVDIPTQNKKNRRLIARVKTIQTQRSKSAGV